MMGRSDGGQCGGCCLGLGPLSRDTSSFPDVLSAQDDNPDFFHKLLFFFLSLSLILFILITFFHKDLNILNSIITVPIFRLSIVCQLEVFAVSLKVTS